MSIKDVNPAHLFKAMQGRGCPKKSRTTVIVNEPDPILDSKRFNLKQALKRVVSKHRFKPKHPLITPSPTVREYNRAVQPKACIKRFAEFMGWKEACFFQYTAAPKLITPLPKRYIYELLVKSQPMICFTDSVEAFATLTALRVNGYGHDVDLIRRDLTVGA